MQSASRSFAFLLVFVLTFSGFLLPQSEVTSLRGTIFDAKGAVVAGATVVLGLFFLPETFKRAIDG